jgi:hypothetical protein
MVTRARTGGVRRSSAGRLEGRDADAGVAYADGLGESRGQSAGLARGDEVEGGEGGALGLGEEGEAGGGGVAGGEGVLLGGGGGAGPVDGEFVGTSISSSGDEDMVAFAAEWAPKLADNPHWKIIDARRGLSAPRHHERHGRRAVADHLDGGQA